VTLHALQALCVVLRSACALEITHRWLIFLVPCLCVAEALGAGMQASVRDYCSMHRPGVDLLDHQGQRFESALARDLVTCGIFLKELSVFKALNGIRSKRTAGNVTLVSPLLALSRANAALGLRHCASTTCLLR
jgi:hypothetical protein